MFLETIPVGALEANCYVLSAGKKRRAVVIDPGENEERIFRVLETNGLTCALVVNTHGHYDHIGCDDNFGVPVMVHKDDLQMLLKPELNFSVMMGRFCKVRSRVLTLEHGQEIVEDELVLEVIHTPGHSPGSICLLLKKPQGGIVFTGDTLFCQGVGRTDLAGGSEKQLSESITSRLLTLPDETIIYPGHGPDSTIGEEKKHNPFL
jgi:glyoxylase-like metal-dependent hydrolase (beta-lactamase superfamily II)